MKKLFQTRFLASGRPERIQMFLERVARIQGACVTKGMMGDQGSQMVPAKATNTAGGGPYEWQNTYQSHLCHMEKEHMVRKNF